ncbi:hypothetical protein BJY54_002875 [Streptomyces nodosus]|nr:hypothetical protein [Streptomyces nodosus]
MNAPAPAPALSRPAARTAARRIPVPPLCLSVCMSVPTRARGNSRAIRVRRSPR